MSRRLSSERQPGVKLVRTVTANSRTTTRRHAVLTTFPRLMLDHAAQRPQAPALREKEYGIWQTLSWSALASLVRHIACGLAEAGVAPGDHVVVIGENRPRLQAAMLAAQSLGAVAV